MKKETLRLCVRFPFIIRTLFKTYRCIYFWLPKSFLLEKNLALYDHFTGTAEAGCGASASGRIHLKPTVRLCSAERFLQGSIQQYSKVLELGFWQW